MYRVCAVCGENVRPKLNEFLDAHGFQPAGEWGGQEQWKVCRVILPLSRKKAAASR